ncbi:MAG: HAD family hydrolase [Bacteroidetes bacterium]|nr:HAD family hydrolase [Bacteroidota bacterium]
MQHIKSRLISAKAFIFDFYGTLVEIDHEPPQMWETLNELGYDSNLALQEMWEADAFDGLLTPSFDTTPSYLDWRKNNIRQLIQQSGAPNDANIDDIINHLLKIEQRATKKAVPNANSVIKLLREHGKRIGLCSNWDHPIQPFLEQAGLPAFDGISVSAEIGARKPNAKIFHDICSKLDVSPNEAVFIGDNWFADIIGAMRYGLLPVWIRQSNSSCPLPNRVLEVETLKHLEEKLELIFNEYSRR